MSPEWPSPRDDNETRWDAVPRFKPPPSPRYAVSRPRLDSLLSAGAEAGLTLVSAPAGTGKTVAVADWASRRETPPIWVAFTGDTEQTPDQLWKALSEVVRGRAAVRRVDKGRAESDGPPLFSLGAHILESATPVEIVLDFDTSVTRSMGGALDQLMRHTGDRLRLVLLTRQDPPMPLSRYLLADRLIRVGAEDLAFTEDEVEQLVINRGLQLQRQTLRVLTRRTRGWAAGLVMASLLLTEETDATTAATRLTGQAGDLAEYMLAEVLDQQAPDMRAALLKTSLVDTLSPGLVERLAGQQAPRLLDSLARGGVFIDVAPDDLASYRYHPLFRDLLRARLHAELPEQVGPLHRAASSWYASQRRINEAIAHLIAAGDWDAVADLVVSQLAVGHLLLTQAPRGGATVPLLSPLPEEARAASASVVRAAHAVKNGDLETARVNLNNAASRWTIEESTPSQNLSLELVQMALSAARGDWDAILASTPRAEVLQRQVSTTMSRSPEVKALVCSLKGRALLARGDLGAADDAFAAGAGRPTSGALVWSAQPDTAAGGWREPVAAAVADCLGHRALIAAWRGELRAAVHLAQQCRALRVSTGCAALVAPAPAPAALAWACIERADLPGTRRFIQQAQDEAGADPDPLASAMLAMTRSRAYRARDDIAGAAAALATHARQPSLPGWLQEHLRLEVARVHLSAGRSDKACALIDRLAAHDPEVMVVRAQAQLVAGDVPTAGHAKATENADLATRVTSLLVEATSWIRQGQHGRGKQALNRSLRLARIEQLRRPFTEAPPDVATLIGDGSDLAPANRRKLTPPEHHHAGRGLQPATNNRAFGPAPQTLTDRERQILALMSDLLTNEEIARSLFVSVNTVRTHTRAILRKLGASRRGDAVRRARQLGLLSNAPEADLSGPSAPRIPAQRTDEEPKL